MKWNLFIDVLSVGIFLNIYTVDSETCSSCPYLEQCEVIICGSTYVDGHMKPEFVSGCSLDCPHGLIECQHGKDNTLSWFPVDPCVVETTTTTTKSTTTTTTTTTTPMVTFLTTPKRSKHDFNDSSSTQNTTAESQNEKIPPKSTPTYLPVSTPSPIILSTANLPELSTLDSWSDSPNKPLGRWVMIWLIPLLAAFAVTFCLIVCCITIHHYKRHRDKVHLNRRKQDGRYDQLVMNTVGSTGNGRRTNSSSYQAGTLMKTQNELELNGSPKTATLNGTISTRRHQRSKLSKRGSTMKKFQSKPSTSQSGAERKIINWQDTGTQEFVTPPSPRSATGLRTNRQRAGSVTFGHQRASSSLSQCSSAFKSPATVYTLRRSPSPLSSQFGEAQSVAQSSVYDSQQLSTYPAIYDDGFAIDGSIPVKGPLTLRGTLGYYPTGDESEQSDRGTWFSRSTHELPSHPDEQMSSLTGSHTYDHFRHPLHTPSAFSSNELPLYQPSNSSIRSNIGDKSPRIPRI